MNTCMKCGRETEDQYMFCESCLSVMEKYPVRPGTPVHLPRRAPVQSAKKATRRKAPTVEEQVISLRKTVRVLLACLLLVSAALGYFVWQYFTADRTAPSPDENPIGQNYTVDSTES